MRAKYRDLRLGLVIKYPVLLKVVVLVTLLGILTWYLFHRSQLSQIKHFAKFSNVNFQKLALLMSEFFALRLGEV
jgi:hypothetical protein